MKLFLIGLAILFILSCQATPQGCARDSDCQTPNEYLVRSNCPFTSACQEGKCLVVCEDMQPCQRDTDCTCSHYAAQDLKRCACIRGKCDAVVKEN